MRLAGCKPHADHANNVEHSAPPKNKEKRPSMWNPDNAITEADAIIAEKNAAIESLRIIKDGDSYHILIRLNWRKEEVYLATVRNREEPRHFKHIGRLFEYIEATYPSIVRVTVVLKPSDATQA